MDENLRILEIVPKELEIDNPDLISLVKIMREAEAFFEYPLPVMKLSNYIIYIKNYYRSTFFWRYFLLFKNGIGIGYLKFSVEMVNNLHLSSFHLYIHPDHRKNGYAKLLIKHTLALVNPDVNVIEFVQKRILTQNECELHKLFLSLGGKLSYSEGINVSDLSKFDAKSVKETSEILSKNADKAGYKIQLVKDGEFEKLENFNLKKYIKLMEQINNSMPKDNASWGDEVWDKDRLMTRYIKGKELRVKFLTFIAFHKETFDPVGMTEVAFNPRLPELIVQYETGVIAPHRGNKLGLTLKYALLIHILKTPSMQKTKYWKTENANSNSHMLSINKELGYETLFFQHIYELPRLNCEKWVTNQL